MYTKEQLRGIFQSKFDLKSFSDLVFNHIAHGLEDKLIRKDPEHFCDDGYYLGSITVEKLSIGVFHYQIKQGSVAHKRVGLRNLVKSLINPSWGNFEAAIVAFSDSKHWRLSFVCDMKTARTQPKRFTFLFGDSSSYYNTAVTRFEALGNEDISFDAIKNAFSVEVLTKQFYKDLFDWFQWAVDKDSGITFPNNTATDSDDRDDIEIKIIRLITRIMFVWFIKQKDLVPNQIFDVDYLNRILKDFDSQSQTKGNYYNAILQNLFFATLNRAIKDENGNTRAFAKNSTKDIKTLYRYSEMFEISEKEVIELFSAVPFLNGGLFECLDKTKTIDGAEEAYNFDGFSRNDKTFKNGRYRNRATIPNVFFFEPERGLISILNRYNFTIEENSPEEQQVALDPELLGKVFENLLAAYNPETKQTARNSTGSFYTPREVVNYMVDESLIAYLGDTKFVRELFSDDFSRDESKEAEYQNIADRLKQVKVIDPACGSGAFPMGLLNRMVDLLKKTDKQEDSSYKQKLSIIESCIYGSDIQCIATQITKLRFFISLICDCEKDEGKENFGIPTLPNLETKFVAANSLIGLKPKKKGEQLDLFADGENNPINISKNKLMELRHRHFSARTASEKRRLREADQKESENLLKLLSGDELFASEEAKLLASWNRYDQNATSPFFDSEWMFGIKDGFDIVIGNPPYIQLQKDRGALGRLYEPCGYETYARTGDIYSLFYERGWQLLKDNGHLCYITSNKWMRAGYGEATRNFFANKTNPVRLVDFAGLKIFESATVDTNILLFQKAKNQRHTLACVTKGTECRDNLSDYINQNSTEIAFANSDSWVVLSPIEQSIKSKIERVGTPLKDWDINIYRGVLTGCNEAFIIDTETRDEILKNCQNEVERQKTAELIRPILRGKDIKRYGYDWANQWVIATSPSKKYNIEDYPSVKEHLLTFARDMLIKSGNSWVVENGHLRDFCYQKLSQTGKLIKIEGKSIKFDKNEEKARKKTNNKWFETQDTVSYWEDFYQQKICWASVGETYYARIDKDKFLLDTNYFFATDCPEYLLAILNSKLIVYWINSEDTQIGNGGAYRHYKYNLEKLTVPQLSKREQMPLIASVRKILEFQEKKLDTTQLEKEIDYFVYKLYELSQDEISFIEGV